LVYSSVSEQKMKSGI